MDLALKWRPKIFAEVVGQPIVIGILTRQIQEKKWHNCYLFCGAHGTGKTTCARIFANAINNNQGEPIEVDAASHNGVDDIRNLIVDAQQSSIDCDYKVYIIDEAHMITTQGWNAALKLIEEPPAHTIFIFCTTNPEKLPQTILSRVQRFDFRRISRSLIADRLEYIMNEESHTKYQRQALDRIASQSNGHMRDAIKLLDRCLSNSEEITLDVVETTLGLVRIESIVKFVFAIIQHNCNEAFEELNRVDSFDINAVKFFDEMLSFVITCCEYVLTENIDICEVPFTYEEKQFIMNNKESLKVLLRRLIEMKSFVDDASVMVLLKSLVIEMSEV